MSTIKKFIDNTKELSGASLSAELEKFLKKMPKKLDDIKDLFKKNEEGSCDFELLVQHIKEKIEQDENTTDECEKFLSGVREKVLGVLYYPLLVNANESTAFYANLDVALTMYEMSHTIGTEFIPTELDSTTTKAKLLEELIDKMESFNQPELKKNYLLKIWANCISPVQQTQAIEGQLVDSVKKFIALNKNAMELLFLYTHSDSFKAVLSVPVPSEHKSSETYTHFERDFVPALSQIFSSEKINTETGFEFAQTVQTSEIPEVYRSILKACLKNKLEQKPQKLSSGFAWLYLANPAVFLEELSSAQKERFVLDFDDVIEKALASNKLNWEALLSYSNMIITYSAKQPLGACFQFLSNYLEKQISEGEDILGHLQQLIKAANAWIETNKSPGFFNTVVSLLNRVIGAYYQKKHAFNSEPSDAEMELILKDLFTHFYNNASPLIRKVILKDGFFSMERKDLSAKTHALFFKALYSNFEEKIDVNANESYEGLVQRTLDSSYEGKVEYIEKLKQHDLFKGNQLAESFILEMLAQTAKDCDTILSNPEESNPALDNFIKSNFFKTNILGRLNTAERKNFLGYVHLKHPELFEEYLTSIFYRDNFPINCSNPAGMLREIFDINPTKFVSCLSFEEKVGDKDPHADKRVLILNTLLSSWNQATRAVSSEEEDNFRQYMEAIKLTIPVYTMLSHGGAYGDPRNLLRRKSDNSIVPIIIPLLSANHSLSIFKNPKNIALLIEINPWILELKWFQDIKGMKNQSEYSVRNAIIIGFIVDKRYTGDALDEIVKTVVRPLYQKDNSNESLIEILSIIIRNCDRERILSSHELCMFLASALCGVKKKGDCGYYSTDLQYDADMERLAEKYKPLQSKDENPTTFDKCLMYVRYSFYPHAESTMAQKVMTHINNPFENSARTNQIFRGIKKVPVSISKSTFPPLTKTVDAHEVNNLWEKIETEFKESSWSARAQKTYKYLTESSEPSANAVVAEPLPEEGLSSKTAEPTPAPAAATTTATPRGFFGRMFGSNTQSTQATATNIPNAKVTSCDAPLGASSVITGNRIVTDMEEHNDQSDAATAPSSNGYSAVSTGIASAPPKDNGQAKNLFKDMFDKSRGVNQSEVEMAQGPDSETNNKDPEASGRTTPPGVSGSGS